MKFKFLFVFALVMGLSSCEKDQVVVSQPDLIGTWETSELETWTFFENGLFQNFTGVGDCAHCGTIVGTWAAINGDYHITLTGNYETDGFIEWQNHRHIVIRLVESDENRKVVEWDLHGGDTFQLVLEN